MPAAVDSYLYRLNMPMAQNPNRHKREFNPFFAPLFDDPAVASRLAQLDGEYTQLREQVSDMLQEPEWNQ
jgi:hypothetical protein